MELRMNGRNALVSGGCKGIGLAIARSFAAAGANVVIVARKQPGLDEAKAQIAAKANTKVITVAADVATVAGCRTAFEAAETALGQVDVLVNNAGTSQRGAFVEITDEIWQHDIDLKLLAAVRLSRRSLPGMQGRRWGRIINILNAGAKAPQANGAPTAVTRAAGMALTKVLSAEGAPHNVLVNALLVGNIESNQWLVRHAAENKGRSLEAFYAEMGKRIPMGRVGTAQEFANMALFLASDAGSYITGTAINVDGGLCPVV
jgi:NAD(P)-dependent dehydrogenase (short-subunit alcohol dehydrogenase family)